MPVPNDRKILFFSFSLAFLVVVTALFGLLTKGTYALEAENWKIQGIGQDLTDLFLVTPVLLISGIQAYRNRKRWFFIFGGTVLFFSYTYTIYCFALHFNSLFLIYCFCFGLSVYAFIYFIWRALTPGVIRNFDEKLPIKSISVFLIGSAVSFYILWLSEIIPAMVHHQVPQSNTAAGIMTNPVHVLDLSLFLPAFIMDAILLMKKNKLALVITPALLVFCILMDLNIAGLILYMWARGAASGFGVSYVMVALALISAYLLYGYFRHMGDELVLMAETDHNQPAS